MKPTGAEEAKPEQRLLAAAGEVFAAKGFRDATVAEICDRAGTNIAAVNYYFRSKEKLYAEAWRVAFHRSLEIHPAAGGVPADAPAAQRLAGRVRSIIERIDDPNTHEFDIVLKEHAQPTGLLVEVMRELIGPMRQEMGRLVRELLGPKASDQQVELCQMSIIAQGLHTMIYRRQKRVLSQAHMLAGPVMLDFSVADIANHIVRFSLAGLREMRQQTASGDIAEAR